MRRLAAALVLLILSLQACAHRVPPSTPSLSRTSPRYHEFTLDNGLHVLLLEKHDVPVVTCMIGYGVGGVNEKTGRTGLSHFLEHMMFKGTDRYGKGEIDLLTMKHGGSNNAFTANDMTAYHFTFSAAMWETALDIEANRMRSCLFDPKEIDSEREVVIEELKGDLDTPWEMLNQRLEASLFHGHPYEHPVIGAEADLRKLTRDDFFAHYRTHYCPNNAVLCVVGDIDPLAAQKKIARLFGPIPKQPLPASPPVFTPTAPAEPRIEFSQGFNLDRLLMAYSGVTIGSNDDFVLDLISDILTQGRTSRLHRRLVDGEGLASDVSAWNDARKYGGAFELDVEMLPEKDRHRAEAIVLEEIDRLRKEPVSAEELLKAKRQIRAGFAFSQESSMTLAERFISLALNASPEYFFSYLAHVDRVTPADIRNAALRILRDDRRVIAWSLADVGGKRRASRASAGIPRAARASCAGSHGAHARMAAEEAALPAGEAFHLGEQWRVVLPNGLTVQLLPRPEIPVVAISAYVRSGRLYETDAKAGVAELMGRTLDAGTPTRTKEQIAGAFDAVGGTFEAGAQGCSAHLLAEDLPLALDVISDVLRNASFPAEEMGKARDQQLAAIIAREEDPDPVAEDLFNEQIYGPHPFHRPSEGYAETVRTLTREDVANFAGDRLKPENTVIAIVGQIGPVATLQMISDRFAAWQNGSTRPAPYPSPRMQDKPEEVAQPMESEQVAILLGHLGVPRSCPDYVPLMVMDYVLGTGTGFTDRISKSLRDEQGLAYGCGAGITRSAGEEPGLFKAWITTQPKNRDAAVNGMRREIERFVKDGPTAEEVANAEEYLCGSLPLSLETSSAMAEYLIRAHRYALPPDYLSRLPATIRAVTVEDVTRVAREYLHPDRMTLVIVGPPPPGGMTPTAAPTPDGGEKR